MILRKGALCLGSPRSVPCPPSTRPRPALDPPPPSCGWCRYLELDTYLRTLLRTPSIARNYRLLEFLGIAKQGVRYGVRNYE